MAVLHFFLVNSHIIYILFSFAFLHVEIRFIWFNKMPLFHAFKSVHDFLSMVPHQKHASSSVFLVFLSLEIHLVLLSVQNTKQNAIFSLHF